VSAFQSHLFNRVVAARLQQGTLGTLLEGDLAWRHAGGAVFRVERPADEAPRAALFELSPSGPLFGRRMTWPAGAPEALERGMLAAAEVEPTAFEARGRVQWKGARRPLRVPLADLALEPGEDEGGPVLSVTFALPAGSYATAVLREVTKDV
jgi:tRNA pseudouridine13 synthase